MKKWPHKKDPMEHIEDIVIPIRFHREKISKPLSPSSLTKNLSSQSSENADPNCGHDELESVFILSSN